MSDLSDRQLIMEERGGPNIPSEFDDYEGSQSQGEENGSDPCSYRGSIELVDFGYNSAETDYPLEQNSAERASLIGSFQTVFTDENSPYDENWDYDTINGFLDWTSEQDYEVVLAVDEGKVAGFSWGYRVDPEQVDVEGKFPEELQQVRPDIYDGETFMIDEVGVIPEYRGQGLGTCLESVLMDDLDEWEDIFRVMQRTQWGGENIPKLQLDRNMGFDVMTFQDGIAERAVCRK